MSKISIPVAEPALVGNEINYVMDCLNSTWISSSGKYIEKFERSFANFIGVKHSLTCNNGTTALHLALLAIGVGCGDEVIVPTLTYVATANAVRYCGAEPVFVDSEYSSWNLDPYLIEEKITERTKAIIVVHLYGHPSDMDPIFDVARRYGLYIIEDAAEAHGARYKSKMVGSIGDISTFSFYGNKIITTGEGGMVCTNSDDLAEKVRMLKGQGQDLHRRYWFPVIGYNYRMTNIEAALGVAQLEKIDWHIKRRQEVAGWYRELLQNIEEVQLNPNNDYAESVYWLSSILVRSEQICRDDVMYMLANMGIETRPFFYPMHVLPPYLKDEYINCFPVADDLSKRGINLPSSALLSFEQVKYVADSLISVLKYR